jgi:hypothetical protein
LKKKYGDGSIPVPDLLGYKPKEPEDKRVRLHRGLEGPGKALKSIIKQQNQKQGVAEGSKDKVHLKTPKHGLADHPGRNTGVGLRTFASTPEQDRCSKCNTLYKNHYQKQGVAEMDNRTPSGDRREQRANSPEEIAKREKEQQADLKKVSPEMRKKLRLPEPKQGVAEGDTLDTGPDGKLTAKGEEQMRRYRQQKREQERQQIIAKHTKTVKGDTYGVAPSRISQSRNEVNWAAANKELRKKGLDEQGVAEGSIQDKLHRRHQELRKKSGLPNPDYYKELRATYDLPDQERYAKAAELKKKYQVKEARKPEVNFDVEDLKKLERIRDLPTLKTLAFELISKPSAKPMKPEKVEWFRAALERMDSPLKVIKLMYDLLLSGEGHAVIGSKNSMKANTYRDRFGEATSDGSVKYEFDLGNGKKDYQISRPDKAGEKAPVDPKSAATIYQLNHPLRKIKSVRVVDKPKEEKSQVTNEDVERYIEELERAGYNILEEKTRLDPKCWKGYRKAGTKMKGDVRVNNCVPIKKKVDEYGAANGPPNLNKSDIKRMMPPEPVAEQIPTISDLNPREQPHPADQALGALRTIKRLAGIDKHDVENAVNQEITNVVRSPHDPSSKNVSIINRLFGRD